MKGLIEHSLKGLAKMDKQRTAVLAVHWQVDAVKPEGILGPTFAAMVADTGVIGRTVAVVAAARRAAMPIVHVKVCYWPGHADLVRNNALFNAVAEMNGFVRGTRGVEFIDELKPEAGDFVVEHSRISSFYGSDLVSVLKARNIETVVVTGIATNVAVDHTIRDAIQLGYNAILLEDCCCSSSKAHHDAALLTLRVLATEVADAKRFIDAIA
ncbi:MAG: cysteine hydrolase [Betaproteobacteria bacterium]|nr:cysteine hydrolase [Betaproteobacteria bacterium]